MSTSRIDKVLDENLVNLGFLLGLGVSRFSDDDKNSLRSCLHFMNDKTNNNFEKSLETYSSTEICEELINVFGYWIEKDLGYSRVKGLNKKGDYSLSPVVKLRLEVRYKARLRKEFRGLAKTARLFRRLVSVICVRLMSDEITDESKIIAYVKRLKLLAGSCNYKLISGLLLMEINKDTEEEQLGVIYICFLSYMSESIELLSDCMIFVESVELNDELLIYKSFLSSRLKKYTQMHAKKCDIHSKNAVKSVLLNVDNKALSSGDWADIRHNVESCRSVLATLSSKRVLLQGK